MSVGYTDRAREDVELALAWYERQRPGLGLEFLDSIEFALKSIAENPKRYAVRYRQYRGCVVSRFPFCVFYSINQDEITVHSVFHHRQSPNSRP